MCVQVKTQGVHASHTCTYVNSYEAERKPVAVANTALSVRNWQQATSVPAALGLSTTAASAVQQAATVAARVLPQGALRCRH